MTVHRSPAKRPPKPARSNHSQLMVIGAVILAAAALLGYGMAQPSTPWAFDRPEAQKPFHR